MFGESNRDGDFEFEEQPSADGPAEEAEAAEMKRPEAFLTERVARATSA